MHRAPCAMQRWQQCSAGAGEMASRKQAKTKEGKEQRQSSALGPSMLEDSKASGGLPICWMISKWKNDLLSSVCRNVVAPKISGFLSPTSLRLEDMMDIALASNLWELQADHNDGIVVQQRYSLTFFKLNSLKNMMARMATYRCSQWRITCW